MRRLRRIAGQARGLHRMVDEDKHCIDIVTRAVAMTSALQAVALGLLDEHLQHCVAYAAALGGPGAGRKLQEASAATALLVRT